MRRGNEGHCQVVARNLSRPLEVILDCSTLAVPGSVFISCAENKKENKQKKSMESTLQKSLHAIYMSILVKNAKQKNKTEWWYCA